MNDNRNRILRLTLSALCLALCMVLPFVTGQIPQVGAMLCPMHLPVLLCGFVCGAPYAAAVGAAAPLLRFALFGMPPIFPTGLAMCFELAAYGAVSGIALRALPRSRARMYIALALAMVSGRVVWGVVSKLLLTASGAGFTWAAFIAGALTNALPGIALQLVLVPVLTAAIRRALPGLAQESR